LNKNVNIVLFVIAILTGTGCSSPGDKAFQSGERAEILPDYTDLVIPSNIAPLNFRIINPGNEFLTEISGEKGDKIKIRSKNGTVSIPVKAWKKLLSDNAGREIYTQIQVRKPDGEWQKYLRFSNQVAEYPIDPYLSYRLLFPGYESWRELSIEQRDIQTFDEKTIISNLMAEENCVNCHSYNNGHSGDFMFHMRGSLGGTYFLSNDKMLKVNLKTPEMKNGAVYPRWHPSGKYVAFSSNKVVQQFHSSNNKKVEVSDLESSLLLYDRLNNQMLSPGFPENEKYMDTYPEWTPDGTYLYFCRSSQIGTEYDYSAIKYDLYRASFDPEKRIFGSPELVYSASETNKSISFPRVSPDGKFLIMTIHDYGCFPIWHKEADLWILDLDSFATRPLELNSDQTDSYHSWSSNSKWVVFSSKRDDGLAARPYISFIDEKGNSAKPFILPQKDPEFYDSFLKTFNIPELSVIRIETDPGMLREASRSEAIQARWAD